MKLRSILLFHLPFLIICLVAFFLRFHRISILTTFGRDQGIDFLTVKEMIVDHKLTLLGIKVSIADFHQGPIYLYMLVPLFLLFGLHPLAGAYTAVLVSISALIILYFTMLRFFDRHVALWCAAVFAVSPGLVREGNTPLYQSFLPPFLFLAIFTLLNFVEAKSVAKKNISVLCLGIFVGICLELHFLAISFAVALFLLLLIQGRNTLRFIPMYLFGLVIGVVPTLLFEVRHEFLNTKLLIAYFSSERSHQLSRNVHDFVFPWVKETAGLFGGDSIILGTILFFFCIACVIFSQSTDQKQKILRQLLIIVAGVVFVFQLGLRSFEPHYTVPAGIVLLLFIPVWIRQQKDLLRRLSLSLLAFLIVLNGGLVFRGTFANHGYFMPAGWSLDKIMKVNEVISNDAKNLEHVNVASLLDGDTRMYPLRYTLDRENIQLDSVEQFPQSKHLYVLSSSDQQTITIATVWEITSLRPFTIGNSWDLGEGIHLYRIDRNE